MDGGLNQVVQGNCLDVMKDIEDESVDLIVTDPPYALTNSKKAKGGFMGLAWDKALPSVDIWKECLRLLKPGVFSFVLCIPRQDCLSRMIVNLEDAGFMVNFSPIYHTFATGFPKSSNMSKLADKRMGTERNVVSYQDTGGRARPNIHGQQPGNVYDGISQGHSTIPITAPASPEAKALEGSYAGYQPKPAVEVVLVAMKPLSEKTYLDQALTNGKGVTWLDSGRIPYEGEGDKWKRDVDNINRVAFEGWGMKSNYAKSPGPGRFAPNLLVSDNILDDGKVRKTGESKPVKRKNREGYTGPMPEYSTSYSAADSGSYSRYFSLDAWAAENLPESVNRMFPFMIVPKPSPREKNSGLDELNDKQMYKCDNSGESLEIFGTTDGGRKPRKNNHPTVKPIKLMSYLIAIGSRPGDVILDPFAGSGTTGIAAAIADRQYILIELDAEYVDIAERRIAWHIEQAEEKQPDLFSQEEREEF